MSLSRKQTILKRGLDIVIAVFGLIAVGWAIAISWLIATFDTRQNGLFIQQRVGRHGRLFPLLKIRTMRVCQLSTTSVTAQNDPRITPIGKVLRRFKLDELPQLLNVLLGHMSLVGPRPDVPGFADKLEGDDRVILSIRPGITGPASIKWRHEEQVLAEKDDPEEYNRNVIFPDKVRLNRLYIERWSFRGDIRLIFKTLTGRL